MYMESFYLFQFVFVLEIGQLYLNSNFHDLGCPIFDRTYKTL